MYPVSGAVALVVLVVGALVIIRTFGAPDSKSIRPMLHSVIPAITPGGNVELVRKVKYVELKKIGSPNPGDASLAGVMNISHIKLYAKGSAPYIPASKLTATASSQFALRYSADQVLNYANAGAFWNSKLTPSLGEWVRVELKEPTALDRIVIVNIPHLPTNNVEAIRILGTQVSIIDTEGNTIKSYVIATNGVDYSLAAS